MFSPSITPVGERPGTGGLLGLPFFLPPDQLLNVCGFCCHDPIVPDRTMIADLVSSCLLVLSLLWSWFVL